MTHANDERDTVRRAAPWQDGVRRMNKESAPVQTGRPEGSACIVPEAEPLGAADLLDAFATAAGGREP